MKILVLEPEAGGHHFVPYVLHLLVALQSRNHDVTLLTTEAACGHPAMAELVRGCPRPFATALMPALPEFFGGNAWQLMRRQWQYYRAMGLAVRRIAQHDQPDLVVVMSATAMDRIMALLGSPFGQLRVVLLMVQVRFHWPQFGIGPAGRLAGFSRWALQRLLGLRHVHAVASIDQSLLRWMANQPIRESKLHFVPDPGEIQETGDPTALRLELGIAEHQRMLLVYGGITARKGLAQLLAALPKAPAELVVVVAGVFDAEQRERCSQSDWQELRQRGQLICLDGFVPLAREASLFRAADFVWLGYEPTFYGQSAVLPQACSAGKPVLAKQDGLIGALVSEHRLGLCFDPSNPAAVAAALNAACAPDFARQFATALADFARTRSFAAYQAAWITLLES